MSEPRSGGLFIMVVLVVTAICSLRPGVDVEQGSNAPVVLPSSSQSSVCSMRASLSPKLSWSPIMCIKLFFSLFNTSSVSESLKPLFEKKIPKALKADRIKHHVTLNPNKASPEETLYIEVPKLEDGVVLVPGSLALLFNLVVSGHAYNFLVNNVSRVLVSSVRVTFAGEELHKFNRCHGGQHYSQTVP